MSHHRRESRRNSPRPALSGHSRRWLAEASSLVEDSPDQLALNVPLEKALLILLEEPLAIERVRQCGETATGHACDQVDLVEQRMLVPLHHDRRAPQLLEHAVGKSGRPGAAAGERQEKECVRVVRWASIADHELGDAVVTLRSDTVYRNVDRATRRAAAEHDRGQKRCEPEPHQPWAHRPRAGERSVPWAVRVGSTMSIVAAVHVSSCRARRSAWPVAPIARLVSSPRRCPSHSHLAGTSAGAPLSLIKTTTNFAGLVLLAFRSTT